MAGDWTRERPKRPGWYKADLSKYYGLYNPKIEYVRVEDFFGELCCLITGTGGNLPLDVIEWWYSKPVVTFEQMEQEEKALAWQKKHTAEKEGQEEIG